MSCLEPRVIKPRVLRLKLAPPGSMSSPSPATRSNLASSSSNFELNEQKKSLNNHESDNIDTISSGWSFLQTLSNTSLCSTKSEEDQAYVHPAVKRSASCLSEKSLEMCTESLGSETGSNAREITDDISFFSFDNIPCFTKQNSTNCETKRVNRTSNFPPPLTSITDLGGVHVRPRREGGRLILEAVASPSPSPCFQAERSDGRLKLFFSETFSASEGDGEEGGEEEKEEIDEESNSYEEEGGEVEEKQEACCEEELEDEMEMTKYGRPRGCKESGKRDIFCDGLATLSFPLFLSVSE